MRSVRVLLALVAVLSITAAGQAAYIATRPKPVQVFDYPVQRVLNGPVQAGAPVKVRGTKCSTAPSPVDVLTVRTWVTVDPPGTIVVEGQTQGTRKPGCTTREFVNLPPPAVAARTFALVTKILPCVSWRVTGRDVPTDPHYLPAVWSTEPFDVCP